jgi:D-glycero-alpha-D-manno-heptose-7-phosphate kinase
VSGRRFEATAPARVELAGGTPSSWAVSSRQPAALTLSVAIDRRAWCSVETGVDGVWVESKDTLQRLHERDVDELIAAGPPALAAHVLRALGVKTGVRVVTQSRVPEDSGLGGPASLAVAIAGAVGMALDRVLAPDELAGIAAEAEACVRARSQDAHAAIHGGVLCLHGGSAPLRVERLAADPAKVEESLLLLDAGGTALPAVTPIDGDLRAQEGLAGIAALAGQVREALLAGRFDDLVGLMAEEAKARRRLAPAWTTPQIERIAEVVRGAGGATRVCGGVVAVWAPPGGRGPGRREAVLEAARKAGLRLFPARVDLRGLDVEACA